MSKRLLIIAYWFPPAGGVPVQRALSLVRYLPDCGFEVHVLAPGKPPATLYDPGLLDLIPPTVRVHRAFTPMPPAHLRQKIWRTLSPGKKPAVAARAPATQSASGWKSRLSVFIQKRLSPDPDVVWAPFAKRKARAIIRKYAIDAVLVTAPPFSAFVVGNALKREFPHLRLISDFRDDWLRFTLGTFDFQANSQEVRSRAERLERETVTLSDVVVHVTQGTLKETRVRYPDQPDSKFVCISNGYDPKLLQQFKSQPGAGPGFRVTYAGTVYSMSTPKPYLDALDSLPEEIRSQVETRFLGRVTESEAPLLENRKSRVQTTGFLPQAEVFRRLEETDYLLVNIKDPTMATGKMYEYICTGKPILAVAPVPGEIDDLLRQTKTGWCADPGDAEGIRAMLLQAFDPSRRWLRDFAPDWEQVRSYARPHLAGEFGKVIEGAKRNG